MYNSCGMVIISLSIDGKLLEKLDDLIEKEGYSSRSEAVRAAIKELLAEYRLKRIEEEEVLATVTAISQYDRRDVERKFTEIRHRFDDIIVGDMHLHVGKRYCVDIFLIEGPGLKVSGFVKEIRSIKGIEHLRFSIVPV